MAGMFYIGLAFSDLDDANMAHALLELMRDGDCHDLGRRLYDSVYISNPTQRVDNITHSLQEIHDRYTQK